ncbi:MAG: hypothetical protein MI749_20545, partial [Desulfovibrionales bacterium]|nr:hypothetical protein [Desulfovibrionales bacterium]
MGHVKGQNSILIQEYIPEVDVVVELREAVGRMRLEVQGALSSGDKKQFDRAREKLSLVKASLMKARQLEAASPNLKKLKWQLQQANRSVEEYRHILEKIIQSSITLGVNRKDLETALQDYLIQGESLLSDHRVALRKSLEIREQKIEITLKLLDIGTRAMADDPSSDLLASMEAIPSLVSLLATQVPDPKESLRIRNIAASAIKMKVAMGRYLGVEKKGNRAALQRIQRAASNYIDHCNLVLGGEHIKLFTALSTGNEKMKLLNDILRLGRGTREDSLKAQLGKNPDVMAAGLRNFLITDKKLVALEQIVSTPKEIAQLRGMKLAVGTYKAAMVSFLDNWAERHNLSEQLNHAGTSVVAACDMTANHGMESTDTMAQQALSSLSS